MEHLKKNSKIFEPGCSATMYLFLRRTLQLPEQMLGTTQKARYIFGIPFITLLPNLLSLMSYEKVDADTISIEVKRTKKSIQTKKRQNIFCLIIIFSFQLAYFQSKSQTRDTINLNNNWHTALLDSGITIKDYSHLPNLFKPKLVNIPHNWDDYYGYRRLVHGNLHGNAVYEKTLSIVKKSQKKYFLFFEGVSSFATVWINGHLVGKHAGGRTTFTLDITSFINNGDNSIWVLAEHPAYIKTLPWVCGGCSDERGFSEGSQPLGIFRPVSLIVTNQIRVIPFGVHAWANVETSQSLLNIDVSIKNYGALSNKNVLVRQSVINKKNEMVATASENYQLSNPDTVVVPFRNIMVGHPILWSNVNPYLYKIKTTLYVGNKVIDEVVTDFGFRTIQWQTPSNQFLLNGKPLFINGVAEYEHLMGQSHAFSHEEIRSRVNWLQAAGFNAFRDAHQPHNLLYGKLFDEKGILWWTQLSAHIWFDSPEFRNNFKQLLKDWVIERRNDPSVIMWGLQNESRLPKDFAEECTQLIRSLDPTASKERLVTTCNGGQGTDWDVPQNWTGTYGGDPDTYGEDLKKQILVGEYGAWRTLDLHTEGEFQQTGLLSENRFTQLMEKKIRLAETVKDSIAGHFFWLLASHDNPGRVQGGEGLREMDRVGPVNYKGMLTPWEEPTDAYYMYRSNYVDAKTHPMVYIVSHTWPNRWMSSGIKESINVYSNCDEVELFNDIDNASLGKRKRNGIGSHFKWSNVNISYNVLYAIGYVRGMPVARDTVVLFHLPPSPNFKKLYNGVSNVTRPQLDLNYVYRINCGGDDYTDVNGNIWQADVTIPGGEAEMKPSVDSINVNAFRQTKSWTHNFPEMPASFASQRRTFSPIKGTKDWSLFQTFRYGKDKLKFEFPLPNGEYFVELYFMEPWIGVGGGIDGTGMRLFDVAFNDKTVLKNFDIWKEAGANKAVKKIIPFTVTNKKLVIHFPESNAGEAMVCAIAIATKNKKVTPVAAPPNAMLLQPPTTGIRLRHWLDIGDTVFTDAGIRFNELPAALYGLDWLQRKKDSNGVINFTAPMGADIFVAVDEKSIQPQSLKEFENTHTQIITDENSGRKYNVYKMRYSAGSQVHFADSQGWLIASVLPSHMPPAYDLKPVNSYKAEVSIISEGVIKKIISGTERDAVISDKQIEVSWQIKTGVADIYSITLKYFAPAEDMKGIIQLSDFNNNVMLVEPLDFKLTKEGKWNTITVHTPGMINAGNYKLVVKVNNGAGLILSNVDVQ